MLRPKLSRSTVANHAYCPADNTPGIGSMSTWLDYRLILLGSMLPDIIDKPLGIWVLRDTLSNGRVFAHTSLFAALLLAVGVYVYISRRKLDLLCLSFGNIAHLGLDEMWLDPRTLFWPLYGWGFARADVSHWLEGLFIALMKEPSVYIPEIIGALLLVAFFVRLIQRGALYNFVRTGEID